MNKFGNIPSGRGFGNLRHEVTQKQPLGQALLAGLNHFGYLDPDNNAVDPNAGAAAAELPLLFLRGPGGPGGPYAVATVPDAAKWKGSILSVTDGATGSPCLAFSNGTNWLRITLGAAIAAS